MRFLKSIDFGVYFYLIKQLLLLFFFYSLCRLFFYWFYIDTFAQTTISGLFIIFLGGLRFDLTAILYINALFILAYIIPHPFRYFKGFQKVFKWVFLITNSIGIASNFIDLGYFSFSQKRTTATLFQEFSNEDNLGNLFFRFLFIDYVHITVLFIVCILLLIYLHKKIKIRPFSPPNKWTYYLSGLALMALSVWLMVVGIRGGFTGTTRPITISNAGQYVERPGEMSLVLNTPFSIMRTLSKPKLVERHYFTHGEEKKYFNPIHTPHPKEPFTHRNVVIFIVESLSREFVGGLNKDLDPNYYQGFTPFLDSLMTKSLVFDNMFANGSKSIDALPSVVTSLPSLILHYVLSDYSLNRVESLAMMLKKKGYQTAFFHGAPDGSMGFEAYMNIAGFDRYIGKTEYNNDDDFDGVWGIWDHKFLSFFADQMTTSFKQPFLTVLFTLSSHHPFILPEKFKNSFPKGHMPLHKNIAYTDYSLKKFFEKASKQPWFKNTIFLITADHAAGNWYYKEYATSIGRRQIPLIIYDPQGKFKGVNHTTADQIDIIPTVLSMLNYDLPFFSFGQNLFNDSIPQFAIDSTGENAYQLVCGDYVIIFDGKKVEGLFNYKKDRFLTHNIEDQHLKDSLATYAKAFIQQYNYRLIHNKTTYDAK